MGVSSEALPFPVADAGIDRRGISLLSIAHIVNDANQSAIPAMIPWLISHRGLNLATAATLVLAMNLSSSVVQPFFGHWSDRRSMPWIIPAALVLACTGTAAIGLAHSLPMMWLAALIAGIGTAAFHPESSRFANFFAGAKRATGVSIFTLGGYLGFAVDSALRA
uniref:Major facilitator superfamily MFS_1 n=1 Tax=mine drainage metagenome TaxID=410659 RepID=E6PGF4_9ZZZZ